MSKAKNQEPVHIQPGRAFEIPTSDADDDASDIAPALSEQEWAAWRAERLNPVTMMRDVSAFPPNPDNLAKTIAIAFDQLDDEDVRKIAHRENAKLLKTCAAAMDEFASLATEDDARRVRGELYSQLHELAEVIESYLPPERN